MASSARICDFLSSDGQSRFCANEVFTLPKETVLNVFPSDDDRNRLVVAVRQDEDRSASQLVLRQETFAEDVGWYEQSCVAIEPNQVAMLKMALTNPLSNAHDPKRGPASVTRLPAIVQFESGSAGNAG